MSVSKSMVTGISIAAALAAAVATPVLASHKAGHKAAKPVSCAALNAIDPDNDGAMTLLEALRAGKKAFRASNPDRDLTLEGKELAGRMSPKAVAAADTIIKDGRIGMLEYLREVRLRFKAANPDGDRTIECDELHSRNGRLLYRLLK